MSSQLWQICAGVMHLARSQISPNIIFMGGVVLCLTLFDLVDVCYLTGLLKKWSQSVDSNFKAKIKNHKFAILVVSLSFFFLVTDILFLGTKKKGGKNTKIILFYWKLPKSTCPHLVTIIELLPLNQARVKCWSRRNIVLHCTVFDLLEVHLIYYCPQVLYFPHLQDEISQIWNRSQRIPRAGTKWNAN